MNVTKNEAPLRIFVANKSQCTENIDKFCTKNEDYPVDYIEKLLQNRSQDALSKYSRVQGDWDLIRPKPKPKPASGSAYFDDIESNIRPVFGTVAGSAVGAATGGLFDIISRDKGTADLDGESFDYREIEMCDSHWKVIFPTSGESADGMQLYIANTDLVKQGVLIQMCSDVGENCGDVALFHIGYKHKCKQGHITYKLLSLVDGELAEKSFKFPAACSCGVFQRLSNKSTN